MLGRPASGGSAPTPPQLSLIQTVTALGGVGLPRPREHSMILGLLYVMETY